MKKYTTLLFLAIFMLLICSGCGNTNNIAAPFNLSPKGDFLSANGEYSQTSSSWGISIEVNPETLPNQYVITWTASSGNIIKWDPELNEPLTDSDSTEETVVTSSDDWANGGVIWYTEDFDTSSDVTVEAKIFKKNGDAQPVNWGKIILQNTDGTFRVKK